MKYVVLIYSNPATWASLPAEEAEQVIKVHNDLIDELTGSGEFVNIYRLAHAGNGRAGHHLPGRLRRHLVRQPDRLGQPGHRRGRRVARAWLSAVFARARTRDA